MIQVFNMLFIIILSISAYFYMRKDYKKNTTFYIVCFLFIGVIIILIGSIVVFIVGGIELLKDALRLQNITVSGHLIYIGYCAVLNSILILVEILFRRLVKLITSYR
jgi:hypothetical protein